ncbi:unnamed protein product [Caenorhabditis bovis]|uniref:Uncharacterized protein n=1 Tax=Caenorhabditis bovis TaxID=2654633 RepID=A0A8S1F971_9PELO|nr:unnamed protein product [Caenorhabditis bovis]
MEQLRFDDQVAAVGSCDYALCRSIATNLASRGAKVVVGGEILEDVNELAVELKNAGGDVAVSTENLVSSMTNRAFEMFGRIDIVVCYTGLHERKLNLNTSEPTNKYIYESPEAYFDPVYPTWEKFVEQNYGRLLLITDTISFETTSAGCAVAKNAMVDFTKSLVKETNNQYGCQNVKCNILAPRFENQQPEVDDYENITPLAIYLCHKQLEETGQFYYAGENTFGKVAFFKSEICFDGITSCEEIFKRWSDINGWSEITEVSLCDLENIDSTPLSLHHDMNSPIAERLRISSPDDGLLSSSSSEQKPCSRSSSSDQTSVQTGHSSVMTEYTRKLREIRKQHEANYKPPSPRPFYVPSVLIGYNIVKRGKKLVTFIFDFERSPVKVYTEICPHAYDVYEITEADFLAEIKEKMNAKGITDDEMEFQCIMRMLTSRISYANDNSYDDIFKMKSKNGPH